MKFRYYVMFLFILLGGFFIEKVNAASYSNTQDLFESTQANNLLSMAISQDNSFTTKKYIIFQSNNNYYLISSSDISISNNRIIFSDSTIISAIRNNDSSYYGYYSYNTYHEESTILDLSYIAISNIEHNFSVSSSRYEDYTYKTYSTQLLMVILGIVFAIFVTKERSF